MIESSDSFPYPIRWLIVHLNRWLQPVRPKSGMDLSLSALYWSDPRWSLLCLGFLLLTLIMPAEGIGVRLCLFYQVTGIDCPGCGMTRGLSHLWRGHLFQSVEHHLFAPIVFFFLIGQSSSLFFPRDRKMKVLTWLDRHDHWFRFCWIMGALCFFVYGGMRIALEVYLQVF